LNILHDLGRSLVDAWADTTTPHSELMITLLAGIATFERHLIKSRTDEGRKRAMARGVRFGRPLKLSHYQRQEALEGLGRGEVQADIARSYGVSQALISVLANAT
jgi:DNA invertase Pin-like site-specific DNA recombinase